MDNSLCEDKKQELVELVCRQTKYTKEEASAELEMAGYDYMQVLRMYLGVSEKQTQPSLSLNQSIFKEFRNFLDKEAIAYQERNRSTEENSNQEDSNQEDSNQEDSNQNKSD